MAPSPTLDSPTLPQLDPLLGRLGELIGLLDPDGDTGNYKLQTSWFGDPIGPIKEIATSRRKELLDLIVSFLGEAETSPLTEGDAHKWYPIEFPDKDGKATATGLYLVTDADPAESSLPIRLGAQFDQNVGPLSAQLQLQLPIFDLGSGSFPLVSGSEPVVVGLQLGLAKGQQFSTENISLGGLKLSAQLSLQDPPVIDLVLTQFSIGGSPPKDLSLTELAKDPSKLLGTALNAAVTAALQLATKAAIDDKADPATVKAILADLLWVLGLSSDSKVPAIEWLSLSDWFDSIVKDPAKLKAWLHGFYCLVKGLDVTTRKGEQDKDIAGDGTVANPFAVSIVADKDGDRILDLTFAVDTSSGVKIIPGLKLSSPTIHPSDDIDIRVEANAQLAGIGADLQPQFKLAAIVEQNNAEALFTYSGETADDAISPECFEAGIQFALEDGKPKLSPFADLEQSAGQGHDAKTKSLIELWQQANPLDDPVGWLLDRLKDEDLWDQIMTRLLPEDCGLVWRDAGIEYAYAPDGGGSSVRLRAALAGGSGIAVNFDASTAVEWVNLGLNGSLTLEDLTKPSAPKIDIAATLGGAPTDKLVPRFTAGFGADGFQLALEMPLDDQPIRLGLVPFRGVENFSIDRVWTILESAVLDNASAKRWIESAFTQSAARCTPATVLTGWGLLTQQDGKYRFPRANGAIDVDAIKALRPEKLIQAALSQFLASVEELQLFKIGSDDALYFTQDKNSSTYGVRFTLPDISIGGGSSNDKGADQPAGTKLTLKAGKWMSGEKDENWLTRSWGKDGTPPKPGIQIDLVRAKDGGIQFAPALKLVSVGFDAAGTAKNPLFSIKGYRAEGVELRVYLDASGSGVEVGGGFQVDRASIPLGPSAGPDAGTKNPVAAGLLSPGASDATDNQGSDRVNPEFGLQISYVKQFDARILSDDDPTAGGKIWIPVGKSFGPLLCRKVGLGFNTDEFRLLVGYDGSVALGPLGIDLIDLTIGIPLKTPQNLSDYTLGLSGLDLSFRGGPLTISGSFLESELNGITQYTGAAMIRTDAFSIAGLGSYASINGTPSLFVFAVLNKDLGGPAFFFVTALAAGFGFKRKLILPTITEVQNFPLVRVIQEPDYIGKDADPKDALEKISTAIPPDPASYWLAVGVRFRSFGLIETVALLSATFGSEFTISILGVSRLTIPSNIEEGKTAICYAELALRAEFNPAVGVLSVEARLTPNSYIFDKSCRLTGGFAFYTWFSGPHAGDFVVTLGGYHPSFVPPPHYPLVPRVGIDWRVSGSIRITGELYFALTPSCLMAGGKLSAVYDGGWVQAWFIAYADFLVAWKPFHYDIQIGVRLGASATVDIDVGLFSISMTISFELGVDLHVYGPDFSGTARIKFYVVSFTISFGDDPALPQPIPWDEFKQSFLPKDQSVCGVNFTGGLMQEWKEDDGTSVAIVNAHDFAFTAQSQTPLTEIGWNGSEQPQLLKAKQTQLGVAPMYGEKLDSKFDVNIETPDGSKLDSALFTSSLVNKGFPTALWGAGKPDLSRPSSEVLTQIPAGISVALSEAGERMQVKHSLPVMLLEVFNYEIIDKNIPWGNAKATDTIKNYTQSIETLTGTIWANDAVSKTRSGILIALAGVTPYQLNAVSLPLTAQQAPTIFQSGPRIAALGELPREDR
ncbi:MAG TPA: DUF6603 domain-containing protein [Terracidiphilus sp.]|jgi:hypothetical protein